MTRNNNHKYQKQEPLVVKYNRKKKITSFYRVIVKKWSIKNIQICKYDKKYKEKKALFQFHLYTIVKLLAFIKLI